MERCRLIEMVTGGLTRFQTEGDLMIRLSLVIKGFRPLTPSKSLSKAAFQDIRICLEKAHMAGLFHGDLTPRNVVTDGVSAELIDWEPILVAPAHGISTDPAPERVTAPTSWLGGCDLLRVAPRDALVSELDMIGFNRLSRPA